MDRLEAMSLLIAVVEAGSFSGASRKLKVALPSLSRKVADLESHLGVRLLTRTTRKLALTEAGEAYVVACRRILEHVADAERAVSSEYLTPKGELTLTAPTVLGRLVVMPVVNAFLANFPEISVRLMLSDRNVHLIEDHVDMAVRVGTLPDSGLFATRVGAVRRIICGSPDFFASHGTPRTPEDLAEFPAIVLADLSAGTSWPFRSKQGREKQIPIQGRLTVNTSDALIEAALAGVGLARPICYQIERHVKAKALRVVLQDYEPAPLPVHLLHAGQGVLPLKSRRFLEFAVPRLRKAFEATASVV